MKKTSPPRFLASALLALVSAAPRAARAEDGSVWSAEIGVGGMVSIADGDLRNAYPGALGGRARLGLTGERFLFGVGLQIDAIFGSPSATEAAVKLQFPNARDFQGGAVWSFGAVVSGGVFFLGSGSRGGMYATLGLGPAVTVPTVNDFDNGVGIKLRAPTLAPFSGTQGWLLVTPGIGAATGTAGTERRIVRGELGTTFFVGGAGTSAMLGLFLTAGFK